MAKETDEQSLNANGDSNAADNSGASTEDSDTVSKEVYENQKKRAEKAEKELKELQKNNSFSSDKTDKAETQAQSSPSIDVDERILKANGMSDELLTQLKDIATLRKVSLIDAQKDSLFVAVKKDYEKEETSKKASVSSSRGSSSAKVQKNLNTPGLTREEHRALLKG